MPIVRGKYVLGILVTDFGPLLEKLMASGASMLLPVYCSYSRLDGDTLLTRLNHTERRKTKSSPAGTGHPLARVTSQRTDGVSRERHLSKQPFSGGTSLDAE